MKKYVVAALAGSMFIANTAMAGSKIFDYLDGGALRINGTYERSTTNNADPFVMQVFSLGNNECLRITGISQGTDLEATLVSPSGRVWRDDDGGGSLRPFIKAVTDVRGWYVLTLSHFAGGGVSADFTLDVGRYSNASVYCPSATTPQFAPVTRSQQKSLMKSQEAGGLMDWTPADVDDVAPIEEEGTTE